MAAMVPREAPPTSPPNKAAGLLLRLLATWRGLLASIVARMRGFMRSGMPAVGTLSRETASDLAEMLRSGAPRQLRQGPALVAGLFATIAGAVGTRLLDPGRSLGQSIALAIVGVAWVVARLAVMRLAHRPGSSIPDAAVTVAWAAGALPQLIAVTPVLRTAAWALGLTLTIRTLLAAGGSRRDALRLAAWGYGIEIVGFFAVALGRSADVALRIFLGG